MNVNKKNLIFILEIYDDYDDGYDGINNTEAKIFQKNWLKKFLVLHSFYNVIKFNYRFTISNYCCLQPVPIVKLTNEKLFFPPHLFCC